MYTFLSVLLNDSSLFDAPLIFSNTAHNNLEGSIPTQLGALTSLFGLGFGKFNEFRHFFDVVFSYWPMFLKYFQM
jgi:hypothetical protein